MFVDRILQAVGNREDRKPKIGAYNIGKCVRSLWYVEKGYEREQRIGRGHVVMEAGKYLEDMVLDLMEEAGIPFFVPETVESAIGFRMRPDAMVWVPDSGWVVAEIKTMSNYGFMRATQGDMDYSYLAQLESYLHADYPRSATVRVSHPELFPKGDVAIPSQGMFLCVRKETLHLHEHYRQPDPELWADIVMRQGIAQNATGPPRRPYAASSECTLCGGKGTTPKATRACSRCSGDGLDPQGPFITNFPCGYCDYKVSCWGPLRMEVVKGKPKWKILGNDEPDAIVA